MCDWPENANCAGGRSGYSGSSNSGYDSFGEDYAYYEDEPDDTTYPYQPGTAAPKYYEEKEYYTEAPRATSAPVYRWVGLVALGVDKWLG